MKKKKSVISNKVWLLISFLAAMLVWYLAVPWKGYRTKLSICGQGSSFREDHDRQRRVLQGYCKQYVMRGSRIWSWLYHIPSSCFSDGMVHTGSEDHRAMDQFYP